MKKKSDSRLKNIIMCSALCVRVSAGIGVSYYTAHIWPMPAGPCGDQTQFRRTAYGGMVRGSDWMSAGIGVSVKGRRRQLDTSKLSITRLFMIE
jgi:hypothetical protein